MIDQNKIIKFWYQIVHGLMQLLFILLIQTMQKQFILLLIIIF